MAEFPFATLMAYRQNQQAREEAAKGASDNNIAGFFQTIANSYLANKQKEKLTAEEMAKEERKSTRDLQTGVKLKEAEAYLGGKGKYVLPAFMNVPTGSGDYVGSPTGQSYQGMPVATPTEETTQVQGYAPNYPQMEDIISNKAGMFIPANPEDKVKKYHYIGKDKRTYIEKDGSIVPGTPEAGSIPRVLPEENPFAGLQGQRIGIGIVNAFNNDAMVKKNRQAIDAATTIRDLISSKNPIAANAIPTYMARLSGEVGNLSEPDKKPFGSTQQIDEKLKQITNYWMKGQLTPENANYLNALVDTIERTNVSNMDRTARRMANQYGAVQGKDPNEIYKTINPDRETFMKGVPTINPMNESAIPNVGDAYMGGTVIGVEDYNGD